MSHMQNLDKTKFKDSRQVETNNSNGLGKNNTSSGKLKDKTYTSSCIQTNEPWKSSNSRNLRNLLRFPKVKSVENTLSWRVHNNTSKQYTIYLFGNFKIITV